MVLRMAVKKQRWDLAAHTIVLAAVTKLEKGERPDDGKDKSKKRRAKREPQRP
jgi:hypothetical protein